MTNVTESMCFYVKGEKLFDITYSTHGTPIGRKQPNIVILYDG